MWILQNTPGEGEETVTFRLHTGNTKTLGRATRADFILDAALVSRIHCRLTAPTAGELLVEDLRSTNGTFVNDKRVKRQLLSAGDRLRIGRVELTVLREARAETEPAEHGRLVVSSQ